MSRDPIQHFQLSETITVSFIIPHFSAVREENLKGLLSEIQAQTFKEVEVLVVCGVSPQGKAINEGVRRAKGSILMVMDDDSRMGHPDVIRNLVSALREDPSIGMAGASVLTPESANAFQRMAAAQFPRFHMPIVKKITDSDLPCHGCVAFPMDFFKQIGMEREDILRGLDPDLRVRIRTAGKRVVLVPDTWVYHPLPGSLWKFIRTFFRNGYGSAYMQHVHPELNYDTDEKLDVNGFVPKRPLLYRMVRFPWRLLQSLFTFQWIRFLGYFIYFFGYVFGLLHLGWKRLAVIIVISVCAAGCSAEDWKAKTAMLSAENALTKAAQLKDRRVPYEKRVQYYAKACRSFTDAYEANPRVFTYNRIEEAVDACWKAEEPELEEKFKIFQEKYAKEHPVEFEHGDAGVQMDMGG